VNLLVEGFDAQVVVDLMERERVGFTFMVPTMAAALARVPSAAERDWSALKVFQVSGAPISETTALECHAVFGDAMFQMYSLTESLTGTYMSSATWFGELPGSQPLRSAGRPSPYAVVRVVGEDGIDVPVGATGEIWLRSDAQLTEYLDDPAATAAKIVDGFVRTGDVGCFDGNGLLYVVDRVDDMIISGGFNISPSEVENVLAGQPGVREVAVFGVPHERWGETPLAVCVPTAGAQLDAAELVDRCRAALGSYKKPSAVVIRPDDLPRTPTGKVDRKLLREPYWAGRDRRVGGS
jgi:acyl-CoA synthetase (AMP-forming)/AMP-acid ligase II